MQIQTLPLCSSPRFVPSPRLKLAANSAAGWCCRREDRQSFLSPTATTKPVSGHFASESASQSASKPVSRPVNQSVGQPVSQSRGIVNDIFTRGRHEESMTRTERILIRALEEEGEMQSKRTRREKQRVGVEREGGKRATVLSEDASGEDREASISERGRSIYLSIPPSSQS